MVSAGRVTEVGVRIDAFDATAMAHTGRSALVPEAPVRFSDRGRCKSARAGPTRHPQTGADPDHRQALGARCQVPSGQLIRERPALHTKEASRLVDREERRLVRHGVKARRVPHTEVVNSFVSRNSTPRNPC